MYNRIEVCINEEWRGPYYDLGTQPYWKEMVGLWQRMKQPPLSERGKHKHFLCAFTDYGWKVLGLKTKQVIEQHGVRCRVIHISGEVLWDDKYQVMLGECNVQKVLPL